LLDALVGVIETESPVTSTAVVEEVVNPFSLVVLTTCNTLPVCGDESPPTGAKPVIDELLRTKGIILLPHRVESVLV
jgi:hypothetical protein